MDDERASADEAKQKKLITLTVEETSEKHINDDSINDDDQKPIFKEDMDSLNGSID